MTLFDYFCTLETFIVENFYLIYECCNNKFRVFLNHSNAELSKKFTEINRNDKLTRKFVLVIEAVKTNSHNKTQYNWECDLNFGSVYAIKVDSHRFYTLHTTNNGFRELFISRYGKKESQENTKKLTSTIQSIANINIQKLLS
jgi:hypothetical protein